VVDFRRVTSLPLVEPIVPIECDRPFDDPAFLFEPKYDGLRALLYVSRRECAFRSRDGRVLGQFQDLAYWVREELAVREAILDGEIMALDPDGRQDYRGLMAGRTDLHYVAFDTVWFKGKDLRSLPLARRKKALQRMIWATSTVLSQVLSVDERGRDLFGAACRLDMEGIVAKRSGDPYAPTSVWYKIANPAYTQMAGRRELFERRR
jgi:bifunctional non-homologous end joining protein LigD